MTDLDLGTLVLGGNVFGWTADEAESRRVLDAFVDAGGRSIDTADVYSAWVPGNSGGESEAILGHWLAGRSDRDELVVATKVSMLDSRPGLSAANVAAAADDSLRRLGTERIDLYYAHRDDESVPQEEYLTALDALVRAGKVRELGASNFSPDRLRSADAVAREHGLTRFTVAQDQWSLVERDVEREQVAALQELDVVQLPYSSLASGYLTGKYRPGQDVDSVRSGTARAYLERPESTDLLAALDDVAGAHGTSVTAVSLAWLRAQPTVAAPIASARTTEQLPALLDSMTLELTADEVSRLSAITAP